MDGIIRASAIAMAVLIMATASVILFTEDSDAYTNSYSLDYETGQDVDENLTTITGEGILLEYSGSLIRVYRGNSTAGSAFAVIEKWDEMPKPMLLFLVVLLGE